MVEEEGARNVSAIPDSLSFLFDPMVVIVIALAVLTGVAIYFLLVRWPKDTGEQIYDPEDLKSRLRAKAIEPAETFGYATGKSVNYGIKGLGILQYAYSTEVPTKKVKKDEDGKPVTGSNGDPKLETTSTDSYLFIVRDAGLGSKLVLNLSAAVRGVNGDAAKYVLVPKESIISVDPVTISDNIPLTKTGQIYRADTMEGYKITEHKVMSSVLEDTLETFSTIAEQLHSMNNRYVEYGKKMEKHFEEKKKYWSDNDAENVESATD